MTSATDLDRHPRVLALLDRLRDIDPLMRDLPIYNARIAIEAFGFRAFGADALLGVVLTPWFMNLVLLPVRPEPMRMAAIGSSAAIALPAGSRSFIVGGDDVVGLYCAHSLHSPVLNFTLPGQARAEARRLLGLLLTPAAPDGGARHEPPAGGLDRRAMLFGGRSPAPRTDHRA